jgi:hypothetical protein
MIRIRISDDALCDLQEGFLFYEAQEEGLGDFSGATSRACGSAPELIASSIAITTVCSVAFSRTAFSTRTLPAKQWCGP